jgi:hypothetical protein
LAEREAIFVEAEEARLGRVEQWKEQTGHAPGLGKEPVRQMIPQRRGHG